MGVFLSMSILSIVILYRLSESVYLFFKAIKAWCVYLANRDQNDVGLRRSAITAVIKAVAVLFVNALTIAILGLVLSEAIIVTFNAL